MSAAANPDVIQRLTGEGLMPLSQVARRLGSLRGGRPVHPTTVGRWVVAGRRLPDGRRVRLEAVRIHGQWVTSWPAVLRYLAEQTAAHLPADGGTGAGSGPRSPAERTRASERAAAELRELGC
jgi:hypothetical protein